MESLNKRARVCFTLFGTALAVALLSLIGTVLLAYSKSYAPAVVCAVLSIFAFYCTPFYYNNAANSRAYAKILLSLEGGADSFEAISEETGIKSDACKKLLEKAVSKEIIKGYEISEDKIIRK